MMARRALTLLWLSAGYALAQPAPTPDYHAQSNLVLVPFHASRGNHYISDLKRSDVVLLEDGVPRDFSILEGPGITEGRAPLELVLLFDTTTTGVGQFWNLNAIYEFVQHWNDAMSEALLEKGQADVRVSVYRYDYMRLERLCRSTGDPKELQSAFQQLLTPISAGAVMLDLPANRGLDPKSDPPKPWPLEAAVGTLHDVSVAPDRVSRMLVVFSEGVGGTTTAPEDVADLAVALAIPVYPVMINYQRISNAPGFARAAGGGPDTGYRSLPILGSMEDFGRLGKLTGGRSFAPSDMSVGEVRDILEAVKNEGLSQYVAGFVPASPSGAPREHKLEIKLASKSRDKLVGGKKKRSTKRHRP